MLISYILQTLAERPINIQHQQVDQAEQPVDLENQNNPAQLIQDLNQMQSENEGFNETHDNYQQSESRPSIKPLMNNFYKVEVSTPKKADDAKKRNSEPMVSCS